MAFDAEGYRKAAKDAGLSDEEIQKDIDEETKGIAAKGADADMANVKVGQDFMGIPEWLQPAAGLATAAALGAGATGLGMKLKDRMSKPEAAAAPRVEPTFGIPEMEPQAQPQGKFIPPQGDVTDVVSRPVGTAPQAPAPAPTGVPQPAPQVAMPGEQQPQMKYGEAKYNVPTASPEVAVAPPAEVAPAPVQPKPVTEIERLRAEKLQFDLEAARNKEARAQEAHATRMANEAKRAETKNQASQGKPLDSVETTMLKQSHQNTIAKAVEADVKANTPKPKPAPAASVAPPVAAPTAPVAASPAAPISDKFVLPISSNPAETALTKEQMSARGWMANQYGGNNKYYESVQDIFGGVPPSYNAAAGEKAIGKDAHQVVMDWRKANIEGPKVNLTHDMKKVLKGGGGMAVLMALPGFAEAAQSKDMGKMSDIFTDFFVLPFAQSREAGMSKREEESIIAGKFKEASKLGSPYRSVPPPR